jgi:hypothetical protein
MRNAIFLAGITGLLLTCMPIDLVDDPDAEPHYQYNFKDQNAQGVIVGAPWSCVAAMAEIYSDPRSLVISLTNEKADKDSCRHYPFSSNATGVAFEVEFKTGLTKPGVPGPTVSFNGGHTTNITSLCAIEILSIDTVARIVNGRIDAFYNDSARVNGNFSAYYCD